MSNCVFMPMDVNLMEECIPEVSGSESLRGTLDVLCQRGTTYGFFTDEKCFGFIGVIPLWQGVADVWAIMDERKFKFPHFVRKQSKRFLKDMSAKYNLHRIQSVTDGSQLHHQAWMNWLGFKNEGVMQSYSADQRDFYRYALTKENI